MSGVVNQRAILGQEEGPDVELIVNGTELYATYHTLDGFPAVYDAEVGLYCYARLVDGRLESTGVSVALPPPPGVDRDATEADHVRIAKISERQSELDRRSRSTNLEEER